MSLHLVSRANVCFQIAKCLATHITFIFLHSFVNTGDMFFQITQLTECLVTSVTLIFSDTIMNNCYVLLKKNRKNCCLDEELEQCTLARK